jgi:hypothetical protein
MPRRALDQTDRLKKTGRSTLLGERPVGPGRPRAADRLLGKAVIETGSGR